MTNTIYLIRIRWVDVYRSAVRDLVLADGFIVKETRTFCFARMEGSALDLHYLLSELESEYVTDFHVEEEDNG